MSNSKNIGQVSGLYISTTAPENTALIWYDSTPNQACHKVYDTTTNNWVALNPQIVSNTTYSELVNNASGNGLVIGKFYCITDRNNTLAIAITMTKVQYTDALGTLIVDDLGSNKIYTITSGNLLIDDILGVYDTVTNKIVYSFTEASSLTSDDFVLGKRRINSRWELFKFKLSKLISSNANNSITWANGLYFSFSTALRNIVDRNDGVVSYNTYQSDKAIIEHNIDIISQQNQDILQRTLDDVTDKTTSVAVYDKQLPITPTDGTPTDIVFGDKLKTIVEKIQRWIKKLRFANGISISNDFTDATTKQYINTNDTVESAFGKIHYFLKNIGTTTNLSSDWTTGSDNPDKDAYQRWGLPSAGDTLSRAFSKITAFLEHLTSYAHINLRRSDYDFDYSTDVPLAQSGDTIDSAFYKSVEKLKQLGEVKNGVIKYNNNQLALKDGSLILGETSVNSDNIKVGDDIILRTDGTFNLGKNSDNVDLFTNLRKGNIIIRPTAVNLDEDRNYDDGVTIEGNCFQSALKVRNAYASEVEYVVCDSDLGKAKIDLLQYRDKLITQPVTLKADCSYYICLSNANSWELNEIFLPKILNVSNVPITILTGQLNKTFTVYVNPADTGGVFNSLAGAAVMSSIELKPNCVYIFYPSNLAGTGKRWTVSINNYYYINH